MPISRLLGLTGLAKPLTSEEGRRVLERDQYRCQYCGLDGASSFENSLIMTVDFVNPRANKGTKHAENLVAACRPCNLIKGRRVFSDLEHAKTYVLQRRDELRQDWEARTTRGRSAPAGM
ncbi:MAG: endonuclease [Candidatus Solibacter sp.]|jgi:5-methylcytosine-specific restriction endonuclease McrA|nr:endonuclease [Candidatus Solibacter sp.]